jgi:hypothetical protein
MNMGSIKRVVVRPFTTTNTTNTLQRETAQYLTSLIATKLAETERFTLVDPSEVNRIKASGQSVENFIDAELIGSIITFEANDIPEDSERAEATPYGGTAIRRYTIWNRKIHLSFSFDFKRTRDGSLVGAIIKEGSRKDRNENRNALKNSSTMLREIVDEELYNFSSYVSPYYSIRKLELMEETSKDKELKARMKEIKRIVTKDKAYLLPNRDYLELYETYESLAAAYNAAVLYEVMGDLENAKTLMEHVEATTGSPIAKKALVRIYDEYGKQQEVSGYFEGNQDVQRASIQYAAFLILNNIPHDAQVAILNNSKMEPLLTDRIVNSLISELSHQGITVLDRNNIHLIDAEKQYQMSGEVSEEDFVGIGNLAGVNTFILVSVTGFSNQRRLQIRILDVARGVIMYQTPESENLNL